MSALSTFPQISKRACSGLNATNLSNQFAFQSSSFIHRSNRAQLNNDSVCSKFSKFLFAQPVASSAVKRICAASVFGQTNVKRNPFWCFPNVDEHSVLPVNPGSVRIP